MNIEDYTHRVAVTERCPKCGRMENERWDLPSGTYYVCKDDVCDTMWILAEIGFNLEVGNESKSD